MDPLQLTVIRYKIHQAGGQGTHWDMQNKGNSSLTGWRRFFRNLLSKMADSVPCDLLLQRVHWLEWVPPSFSLLLIFRPKSPRTFSINISDTSNKTVLLYRVTNRRALGVALGIIGLLVLMVIIYACVTWFQDDKRGYTIPPGQQKRNEIDENDTLFSVTSSMYYNR